MKISRAGILPYAFDKKGNLVFLFGKEFLSKYWSPFVGRIERNETITEAAIREFTEESIEIIDRETILASIQVNNYVKLKNTLIYLVPIEYDRSLERTFNQKREVYTLASTSLNKWGVPILQGKEGSLEKTRIRWFHFDQLKSIQMGVFGQRLVNQHLAKWRQRLTNNFTIQSE